MNENQDLRRRSYRMIKDHFIQVRGLQLVAEIETSVVFEILANVFRLTGDRPTNIFLIYLIRLVREQERKNRRHNG